MVSNSQICFPSPLLLSYGTIYVSIMACGFLLYTISWHYCARMFLQRDHTVLFNCGQFLNCDAIFQWTTVLPFLLHGVPCDSFLTGKPKDQWISVLLSMNPYVHHAWKPDDLLLIVQKSTIHSQRTKSTQSQTRQGHKQKWLISDSNMLEHEDILDTKMELRVVPFSSLCNTAQIKFEADPLKRNCFTFFHFFEFSGDKKKSYKMSSLASSTKASYSFAGVSILRGATLLGTYFFFWQILAWSKAVNKCCRALLYLDALFS